MNAERWRQVETLFHSALEQPPARRQAFLAEACGGDWELSEEVESLLAALAADGELNETAAPALAEELLRESGEPVVEGSSIAHYNVIERIGSGGMGEVFRALDMRLHRTVALKLLRDDGSGEKERAKRFLAEARAASALNHANIATIYELGEVGGRQYIAMEYVEGETLAQRLQRGPLSDDEIRRYGREVAEALAEAHSKGIIHRDIKPGNLMITAKGSIKVLDFGVAKVFGLGGGWETLTGPHTIPGMVVGTLQYMSPEQLRGEKVDARADLFSLGAVLYQMATGRSPFDSESPTGTMTRILHDRPERPSRVRKSMPADLERVILRCLEKNRENRFASAVELASALKGGSIVSPGRLSRRAWLSIIAALLVVVAGAWALLTVGPWKSHDQIRSLAVLPLRNLTGSPAQQYLVDGVTESLITDLAGIRSLRVISRTSVMQYKGSDQPLGEIGRSLNVDALVDGAVSRNGNTLRVSARLVRAATGTSLWAKSYDGDARALPELQRELARDVAREVEPPMTTEEAGKLATRSEVDPSAYESYLRGRYQMSMRTPETLQDSIRLFEAATREAPAFAQAYSGIADAYSLLTPYANLSPQDTYPKSKAAAVKALAVNDELGEAHASLAVVEHEFDWNHASAEKHFRRALELSPSYANAHQWYGEFLTRTRRFDEAIPEIRKALALDPLSLIVNSILGWAYSNAGKQAEAMEQLRKTIDLDPKFAPAHGYLAMALLRTGSYAAAHREFQAALDLSGRNPRYLAGLGAADALAGQKDRAEGALAELTAAAKTSFVPAYHFAMVEMAMGDRESALEWLDRSSQEHGVWSLFVNTDPIFDPLRGDERFKRVLRRLGFGG